MLLSLSPTTVFSGFATRCAFRKRADTDRYVRMEKIIMEKKEAVNINELLSLIPDDPTVEGAWIDGNSIMIRSYHLFPDNFVKEIDTLAGKHGCTLHTWENINEEELIRIGLPNSISFSELKVKFDEINAEFIKYLSKYPNLVYELNQEKFLALIAELFKDMGYAVNMLPTEEGPSRFLLASIANKVEDFTTLIDCKECSKSKKISAEPIQRLLWLMENQYRTSKAMIATTSFFTNDALNLSNEYRWKLSLKDFNDIKLWLQQYGSWIQNDKLDIWLPNNNSLEQISPSPKNLVDTSDSDKIELNKDDILILLKELKNKYDTEQTLLSKANLIFELRPNIMGIGINFNELIRSLFSKGKEKNK